MEWNFILNWVSKRKIITALLLAFVMSMLCACGDEIPELTDEEISLIADYSSALLLKYDSNTPSRLLPEGSVDMSIVYHDPQITGSDSDNAKEELNISGDIETVVSNSDVTVSDTTEPEKQEHAEGFTDFLADTGITVEYAGEYEIADTYPVENENVYFTVDASKGNKLLVMHFTLTNVSGEEKDIKMNSLGLKYRISINDGKNKNVMTTMLANDILTYTGTLAADESADLVAIAEIPEDETDISTLKFVIRGEEFSSDMMLK